MRMFEKYWKTTDSMNRYYELKSFDSEYSLMSGDCASICSIIPENYPIIS
jgi:hypothetical protein